MEVCLLELTGKEEPVSFEPVVQEYSINLLPLPSRVLILIELVLSFSIHGVIMLTVEKPLIIFLIMNRENQTRQTET